MFDYDSATKEQLVDRIFQLEVILEENNRERREINLINHFNITKQQAIILCALLKREIVRSEYILALLDHEFNPTNNLVSVQINNIKKRTGLKINNIYGIGYSLNAEDTQRVKAIAMSSD
ncbi:helix-turn-helix domain-containing protein [Bartonella tamiae]|uniref:helix-turn-helix domain-containing protein n=1 Tax=Bartonella tamiae TaxID=373638 RepID=UPI00026E77B6|nr:helix-turn-helix domain-containing protein [Bartonella tamiae]EJF92661.1 hypothetical protein MEG_01831 [Bartonella tamiae Th307]